MRAKLEQWGGNASGVNVANIDNLGNVHPDTFWWHYTLGNVRGAPFSEIWPDTRPDHGRAEAATASRSAAAAAACRISISAAATRGSAPCSSPAIPGPRIPACYLSDDEIGVEDPAVARAD